MKKQFNFFVIFVFIAVLLLASCKRDRNFLREEQERDIQADPPLPVDNNAGVMIFSSSYVMDSVLIALDSLSDVSKKNWEISYGFTSMRRLYDSIATAENNLADSLENANDSSEISGPIHHSNVANQYSIILLEREIPIIEGGGGYYEMNMRYMSLASITDFRGLVIVGDTLFKFSYDTMKYMVNGSVSDINTLLSQTTTDSSNGIYVKPILNYGFIRKTTYNPFNRACRNTNGRTRVHTYQDFMQGSWFVSSHTVTTYAITVKGFKRRLFGAWWDSKSMSLELTWEITGNNVHEGAYLFSSPPQFPTQNLNFTTSDSKVSAGNQRQFQLFMPHAVTSFSNHITNDIANVNYGITPSITSASVTGKGCDSPCAQCTTTF